MTWRISPDRHLETPMFQALFDRDWMWLPRNPYWTRTHHLGWLTIIFPGYAWRDSESQACGSGDD